jgi:hypothetical protein
MGGVVCVILPCCEFFRKELVECKEAGNEEDKEEGWRECLWGEVELTKGEQMG